MSKYQERWETTYSSSYDTGYTPRTPMPVLPPIQKNYRRLSNKMHSESPRQHISPRRCNASPRKEQKFEFKRYNYFQDHPIVFYQSRASSSCASVLVIARWLNLDLTFVDINLAAGEHKTERFLRLNPAGAVPVIEDKGLILSESRAITRYLVNAYGSPETEYMYSRNPALRADVDNALDFDLSMLSPAIKEYIAPLYAHKLPAEESKHKVINILKVAENLLGYRKFFGGDRVSIADISIYGTLIGLLPANYDFCQNPVLHDWLQRIHCLPHVREAYESYISILSQR